MSAPIIIGRRCSTGATIRRSRISIRPASRISARTACCSTSPTAATIRRRRIIGAAIREECGLTDDIQTISEVPSRSLLSRLTDHYMQIIANRAPIGFEAEFVNQRGDSICYRGILMPFSSDDDTIDFIYGVINWKDVGASPAATQAIVPMLPADPEPLELEEIAEPERSRRRRSLRWPLRPPTWRGKTARWPRPMRKTTRNSRDRARRRRRPRRSPVGGARDRRGGQVGRRTHPLGALSRAWPGL